MREECRPVLGHRYEPIFLRGPMRAFRNVMVIDLLSGGVSVGFEPWQDVHYLGVTFAVFLVSREHLSVCGRREVCVPLAGPERHLAPGEPPVLVNDRKSVVSGKSVSVRVDLGG